MPKHSRDDTSAGPRKDGFFASLLRGLVRDSLGLLIPFVIGTAAGAVMCLYFGAPLILSLLGGILVLAVYVAWDRL